MASLRNLRIMSKDILPKISDDFTVFRSSTPPYGAVLTVSSQAGAEWFVETDYSNFTSEEGSDSTMDISSAPVRKRQRLDHLSHEEKIMRRKLKNRVAAQSARDRKKAKMTELEDMVMELEAEKKFLLAENIQLKRKNAKLEEQNAELKLRLTHADDISVVNRKVAQKSHQPAKTEAKVEDGCGSLEQAEGTGSTTTYSLDDAIRMLAGNSECDDLLDMLQQCSEELLQCDLNSPYPETGEVRKSEASSNEVVGTTSKGLESIKELIQFDHIYYKQEADSDLGTAESLLSQEDTTKSDISTENSIPSVNNECLALQELNGCSMEVAKTNDIPVIHVIPDNGDANSVSTIENLVPEVNQTNVLSVSDIISCRTPSPAASDAGYDSSFSVSSPFSDRCSSSPVSFLDEDPWDESFTELFPSLV